LKPTTSHFISISYLYLEPLNSLLHPLLVPKKWMEHMFPMACGCLSDA